MKVKEVLGSRRARIGALALVFIGLTVAVSFAYWEMRSLRRDLYAVRGDYYQYLNEDYSSIESMGNVDAVVKMEILSQEVKKMPVEDTDYNYSKEQDYTGPHYEDKDVRVVKVRITNNQDWIYSHYGNIGYQAANGIIVRTVPINPDTDLNPANTRVNFDLAPKGSIEHYLYFLDEGTEIRDIVNMDNYGV